MCFQGNVVAAVMFDLSISLISTCLYSRTLAVSRGWLRERLLFPPPFPHKLNDSRSEGSRESRSLTSSWSAPGVKILFPRQEPTWWRFALEPWYFMEELQPCYRGRHYDHRKSTLTPLRCLRAALGLRKDQSEGRLRPFTIEDKQPWSPVIQGRELFQVWSARSYSGWGIRPEQRRTVHWNLTSGVTSLTGRARFPAERLFFEYSYSSFNIVFREWLEGLELYGIARAFQGRAGAGL